jgi:hypothetical protein
MPSDTKLYPIQMPTKNLAVRNAYARSLTSITTRKKITIMQQHQQNHQSSPMSQTPKSSRTAPSPPNHESS